MAETVRGQIGINKLFLEKDSCRLGVGVGWSALTKGPGAITDMVNKLNSLVLGDFYVGTTMDEPTSYMLSRGGDTGKTTSRLFLIISGCYFS